jgi:hypothetical protein
MREEKRVQRLRELIGRLDDDQDVAVRDMKAALTTSEYESYCQNWQGIKEFEADQKLKPDAIKKYEKLLKKAQFLYNKGEGYSASISRSQVRSKDGRRAAEVWHERAEIAFGKALERLEELVGFEPSLHEWFDRRLDFGADGNLGPSPGSMPMVKTSRSRENLMADAQPGVQSKRSLKRYALQQALESLVNHDEIDERAQAEKVASARELRAFIKRRKVL